MGVFEGKSPAERNKIIAAIVLGVLAVISLIYTFGGSIIGGKTTVKVDVDASPTATVTPGTSPNTTTRVSVPNEEEIYSDYTVTPILFNGVSDLGPIGSRNIFAFYEPPAPTPPPPPTPTPTKTPTPFKPPPPPTPYPITLSSISPQSKYAGENTFRLEVSGNNFKPESKIVFNGTPLQTTFVSEQRIYADVPGNFISSAGFGQVYVDTFDGKNFSDQISFNIQEPPKPSVEYIGMIQPKSYNNVTAYFQKKGDQEPVGKRLNDVVENRFRLISISEREVELEDTRLGFRHKLPLLRADSGTSGSGTISRPTGRPIRNNPTINNPNSADCIPGIPCDIPRATPRPVNPNSNVKRP